MNGKRHRYVASTCGTSEFARSVFVVFRDDQNSVALSQRDACCQPTWLARRLPCLFLVLPITVALLYQIFMPFIVVSSSNDTVIQCEMAENREDVFFNFR